MEKFKVKGLTCKSCKNLIESDVKKLEGVDDVKVDLATDEVSVGFDPEKIKLKEIKAKIDSLGYSTKVEELGSEEKKSGIRQGILYGIIPHIGCIAFIIGSVLGVTVLMNSFRPLLMNRYFFHWLFAIAIGFATLSSALYLRKNGMLSIAGIKKKKKYLGVMYGSTVGINLVLFLFIFPLLANVSLAGAAVYDGDASALSGLDISVDIPCPGHAPLITNELKTIDGVVDVTFSFPNDFEIEYDSTTTSIDEMLGLAVFDEYPATILSQSGDVTTPQLAQVTGAAPSQLVARDSNLPSTESSCGGSGGCGCGGGY